MKRFNFCLKSRIFFKKSYLRKFISTIFSNKSCSSKEAFLSSLVRHTLKTCSKNHSYISKTSRNKIIKCCGQVISEVIIKDIKSSMFFCIIADKASDSSRKEQMSLLLRFVDSEMNIREAFITFYTACAG